MAKVIPYELISHTRRIGSLYKKVVRDMESWHCHRNEFRYRAVKARVDFDLILQEKDMIKAKQMLDAKESYYLRYKHYDPKIYPLQPGGTSYEREVTSADWVLDYWDPIEKAEYPEFFAKREIRKQQFIKMWEKQYGPPPKNEHH